MVAVFGVACMMIGDTNLSLTGVLFGLASGICYAAYGVMGKEIVDHLLIVIGTLLPFVLFTQGLKYLKATQASIYTVFEALIAVLLAALLMGIQLLNMQILGIILIISVSILNVLFSRKAVYYHKVKISEH